MLPCEKTEAKQKGAQEMWVELGSHPWLRLPRTQSISREAPWGGTAEVFRHRGWRRESQWPFSQRAKAPGSIRLRKFSFVSIPFAVTILYPKYVLALITLKASLSHQPGCSSSQTLNSACNPSDWQSRGWGKGMDVNKEKTCPLPPRLIIFWRRQTPS